MRPTFKILAAGLALLSALLAVAGARAADDFLPARDAYRYQTSVTGNVLIVRYDIAEGYYLYRDRLGFESATPGVTIGRPSLPVGEDHEDDYFGKQVIYRGTAKVGLPVAFDGPPRDFELRLKLQGCADAGLCYPPQNWPTTVKWPAASTAAAPPAAAGDGFSLRRLLGRKSGPMSEGDFLPADQAFVFSTSSPGADRIVLRWDIADDYYLYRDKVKITTPVPGVQLGTPRFPPGETRHDEYFGEQVVYHGEMQAELPVVAAAGTTEVPLDVVYQGCADAGLCYPPIRKHVTIALASRAAPVEASAPPGAQAVRSEQDLLADRIRTGSLLAVVGLFFVAGLGLALTPCVWPMVPILSGIIVGAGSGTPVSRGRAFSLSLAYVLGMAFTYTIAGAAFAAAGQQAQAFFQKPWMIALFAALFVWLALGMFGVFTLQVPAALQSRISALSDRQKQGTLLGTAIVGALSSLIVTACVAPPLVASLAVISQTGDVLRGGLALFSLSLGMGAPLLLVGASAGQFLPKAGPWMDTVKQFFGIVMLGVAIWMIGRVLPGPATLGLWAALAFVTGYWMLMAGSPDLTKGSTVVRRGFGVLAMLYGAAMLVGALAGRSDPLQPLAGVVATPGNTVAGGPGAQHAGVAFKRIKSVDDLQREVAAAQASGRTVMLDFYADWCVSCKEMEKYTFTHPSVRAALQRAVLLQADVTANDETDQALLQHFGILGPPSILFFGLDGLEKPAYRVVGFKPADEFEAHVRRAFAGEST